MDVDEAADELYGLMPDEFMARRSALAAQAKAAGDASARAAITAMRRPTVAAWAVNVLVRADPDGVEELLGIAAELREAQRELDGDRLREISGRRRAAITALAATARAATAEAGRAVTDTVLREVQSTLDAAVADENAESALRTGCLTTALHYSGFGEVDISDAVAASNARPRLTVVPPPAPAPKRQTKAARDTVDHEAVAATRQRAVEAARAALDEATDRRDVLLKDTEHLRRRLEDLERELRPAEAEVRAARRKLDTAERRRTQT